MNIRIEGVRIALQIGLSNQRMLLGYRSRRTRTALGQDGRGDVLVQIVRVRRVVVGRPFIQVAVEILRRLAGRSRDVRQEGSILRAFRETFSSNDSTFHRCTAFYKHEW